MMTGLCVLLLILLVYAYKDLTATQAKLKDAELKLLMFGKVPEEYR